MVFLFIWLHTAIWKQENAHSCWGNWWNTTHQWLGSHSNNSQPWPLSLSKDITNSGRKLCAEINEAPSWKSLSEQKPHNLDFCDNRLDWKRSQKRSYWTTAYLIQTFPDFSQHAQHVLGIYHSWKTHEQLTDLKTDITCECVQLCLHSCVCTVRRCHVHQQLVLLVCRLAEIEFPWSLWAFHSSSKHSLHDLQQPYALVCTKLLLSHTHTHFSTS